MPLPSTSRSALTGPATPFAKSDVVEPSNGTSGEGALEMATVSSLDREVRPQYPPDANRTDSAVDASATALKQRNSKPITTYLTQFQLLSHREYLNLKRDWSLVLMHNVVAAVVGVFVGGLYFHVDTTISGFQVSWRADNLDDSDASF